ncbi:MAG: hypothetical protein LBH18_03335 [Spirochaetaceae bacterium]|jgi:hypothetical protein|nr:hypothetical protein [Spirochaetaceae bacterium]
MVYLARKNGAVIFHTDLAAMKQLDGIGTAEKVVSDVEWEKAGGIARVIGNKIVIGKTPQEAAMSEALESAESEMVRIKTEIANRDYRALKAQKLGRDIDELYPGETDWYKAQLERISELEAIIEENKVAA